VHCVRTIDELTLDSGTNSDDRSWMSFRRGLSGRREPPPGGSGEVGGGPEASHRKGDEMIRTRTSRLGVLAGLVVSLAALVLAVGGCDSDGVLVHPLGLPGPTGPPGPAGSPAPTYVAGTGIDIDPSTDEISVVIGTTVGTVAEGNHLHDATYWKLAGNAGTVPGTDFVGTTDAQALELRVNGARALRLEPNGTNSPNVIGGHSSSSVTAGALGAVISGGGGRLTPTGTPYPNSVTDDYGAVGGGLGNRAGDDAGTTGDAGFASVGGGADNTASGMTSTVGGGGSNTASGNTSTVGGGIENAASGPSSTVGGGVQNAASGTASTVGGGDGNRVTDDYGTVGGGQLNQAGDDAGTTGDATHATVGGGFTNFADDLYATVGGGGFNVASGWTSTVGGGGGNSASGGSATVGGGGGNTASGLLSTVSGGSVSTASGDYATVGGGASNTASGDYATVPGGISNVAGGLFSFAAGRRAKTNHAGAFVWGDSTDFDFNSSAANEFAARATGGVRLVTAIDGAGAPTKTFSISNAGDVTVQGNVAAQTLTVGGGTPVASVLSTPGTLDFPATPAQTSSDLTITVAGAAVGDTVALGAPNGSVLADSSFSAWVSAADTVTVRFNNYSAGAQDPASGTFRATVIRF